MKRYDPILCFSALLLTACGATSAPISSNEQGSEITSSSSSVSSAIKAKEITIRKLPDKMNYYSGDMFDPTGMIVDAVTVDDELLENVAFRILTKEAITKENKSIAIAFGGLVEQFDVNVTSSGNKEEYSVASTPSIDNSPLKNKTFLFLGSSVTYGEKSYGESIPDYLAKKHQCTSVKEAVSGTTLMDKTTAAGKSYVRRLEEYLAKEGKANSLDGFILQLSTNDISYRDQWGSVAPDEEKDASTFDKQTTIGAMEYIFATIREAYHCPLYLFSNSRYNDYYGELVKLAIPAVAKWDVTFINLHDDAAFNDITPEQHEKYMDDNVHPSRCGYRDWWLPKFEEAFTAK